MGKKKSKTGKQKQAKQASRCHQSKFGGIVVKKGGGRRLSPPQYAVQVDTDKHKSGKPQAQTKKRRAWKCALPSSPQVLLKTHYQQQENIEHDDFARQMASAQERQSAACAHSTTTTRNKRPKQQASFSFSPATLIVNDKHKTTCQLLEETTSQIQQGFHGIGSTVILPHHQASSSSLAMAAATIRKSEMWNSNNTDMNKQGSSTYESSNNIYAILGRHEDSDDDDDDEEKKKKKKDIVKSLPTMPLFRLAPATFTLGGDSNDDIDPDL